MHPLAIGVDLGGTNVKAALVQRGVGLLHELTTPTGADDGPAAVLDRIAALVEHLLAEAATPPVGLGVGSPGNVSWDRTTVTRPPNFDGWDVVDVRAALQARLGMGLPVVVENDANVAALGSAHYGAGKRFPAFIMVTLGTGVGGAIIFRGELFRGVTGAAGEIGHMTIDYEGPVDNAGVAGAIEAYMGQQFLSHHARLRLRHVPGRLQATAEDEAAPLTPRMLYEAARDGDAAAQAMLDWAGHKLGCVLGSAVSLLDIRKVVVGGGVSGAGDYLLDAARRTLPRFVMPGMHEGLEIVQETRGNEVGMLGAAHLAFQHLAAGA